MSAMLQKITVHGSILILILTLTACGSSKDELEFTQLIQNLSKQVISKPDTSASQGAVMQITRAQVDAFPQSLIRVRIEGTGAMSTLAEVDRKGIHTTYRTGDGVALMFRAGVLIGTRGLGQDLMALSAPDLSHAVTKGESTRRYRYLDGDEQLVDVVLRCRVASAPHGPLVILGRSYRVNRVSEHCANAENTLSFENFYWVESATGHIRQSRQYISPKFQRAEIEVLKIIN